MKSIYSRKIDALMTIWTSTVILAYFETFGDGSILFYLIHTPYALVLLPSILFIFHQAFHKRFLWISSFLVLGLVIFLEFFASRAIPLRQSDISEQNFRICSWNTAYFFQWGSDAAVAKLKETSCNVILFQEIWRSDLKEEAIEKIRQEHFPNMTIYTDGEFQFWVDLDAAFDRYSKEDATGGHYLLSIPHNGKRVSLINVHLWTPLSERPDLDEKGHTYTETARLVRKTQKSAMVSAIREIPINENIVIIGDFNTLQNGKILRELSRDFTLVSTSLSESRNTFPVNRPLLTIDYAFVDNSLASSATLVKDCSQAGSDHCLMILDIML